MTIKDFINKKDIKKNPLRDYSAFSVPNERERLILSEHIAIDIHGRNNLNTLVIGPTGSGKNQNFIEPNMFDNPKDTCFVVMDTDNEIYNRTHETMEEMGYQIEYFDPYNKNGHSVKYAPLNYCFNSAWETVRFIDALYEEIKNNKEDKNLSQDPFWDDACVNILSLIALYMRNLDNRNFSDMLKYLQDFYSNKELFDEAYNDFSKRDDEDARLFTQKYNFVKILPQKTLQVTIMTLIVELAFMESEVFKDITNPLSDCKIYTMFNRPTVFYIEFQSSQEKTYNFLSEMLLIECIKEIQKRSERSTQELIAQEFHVRFILDHFPILGNFARTYPDFIKTLALARSYKMSFYFIMQSLSQIKGTYGWQEIVDLMSNKVIFGNNILDSQMLNDFIDINETSNFSSDEALVIVQGMRCPRIDKKYDFDKHNYPCIACLDANCEEPTKRIIGISPTTRSVSIEDGKVTFGTRKRTYNYTCKYIENGEKCPYNSVRKA